MSGRRGARQNHPAERTADGGQALLTGAGAGAGYGADGVGYSRRVRGLCFPGFANVLQTARGARISITVSFQMLSQLEKSAKLSRKRCLRLRNQDDYECLGGDDGAVVPEGVRPGRHQASESRGAQDGRVLRPNMWRRVPVARARPKKRAPAKTRSRISPPARCRS